MHFAWQFRLALITFFHQNSALSFLNARVGLKVRIFNQDPNNLKKRWEFVKFLCYLVFDELPCLMFYLLNASFYWCPKYSKKKQRPWDHWSQQIYWLEIPTENFLKLVIFQSKNRSKAFYSVLIFRNVMVYYAPLSLRQLFSCRKKKCACLAPTHLWNSQ